MEGSNDPRLKLPAILGIQTHEDRPGAIRNAQGVIGDDEIGPLTRKVQAQGLAASRADIVVEPQSLEVREEFDDEHDECGCLAAFLYLINWWVK